MWLVLLILKYLIKLLSECLIHVVFLFVILLLNYRTDARYKSSSRIDLLMNNIENKVESAAELYQASALHRCK